VPQHKCNGEQQGDNENNRQEPSEIGVIFWIREICDKIQ
jgi:hypothetical protein